MSSRMEQIIDEIEEYIDDCKPQAFSNGEKIVVNRDHIMELIQELRQKTPEEIKRYQKIISNQEAILADARMKADEIIKQAQIQTNELISEHEIMQQAYAQANEVVQIATQQAQQIMDEATNDANDIRLSAMSYTDALLKEMQDTLAGSIADNKARSEALERNLQGYLDTVTANRNELNPEEPAQQTQEEALPTIQLISPEEAASDM